MADHLATPPADEAGSSALPLSGQVALVTGASRELGLSMSWALARAGAEVIMTARKRDEAVRAATAMSEAGHTAHGAEVDVDDERSVIALREHLDGHDVSILVNNAGIPGPVAPLTDVTAEEWDSVFRTNVRGTFLMCREFLPRMISARRGHIVNVASISGKRPLAARTPYTSSKTALFGLTTTLAHEVGQYGVLVNTLSPGPIASERMSRNFRLEAGRTGRSADEVERELISRSALGRMVTQDEVAQALVAMLCMPGLTGADIDLSAGMIGR